MTTRVFKLRDFHITLASIIFSATIFGHYKPKILSASNVCLTFMVIRGVRVYDLRMRLHAM